MPSKLPRLIDIFGPDKPKPAPMSRRRRAAFAEDAKPGNGPQTDKSRLHKSIGHDGKPRYWVEGEPIPLILGSIVRTGNGMAKDQAITFDGAVPSRKY